MTRRVKLTVWSRLREGLEMYKPMDTLSDDDIQATVSALHRTQKRVQESPEFARQLLERIYAGWPAGDAED